MVSIPPLLGQPCQIQSYGPLWTDENLQIVTDNDDGADYVLVVANLCNRRHKMTFKMINSDRVVTREIVLRKRICALNAMGDRNDKTTKLLLETKK